MVEKFNFYDIYGYLLPGLLLLTFLWLPFGLLLDVWPDADWSSALIASAAAYLLGHLLQSMSRGSLSFKRKVDGVEREPADFLLDDNDKTLSVGLKKRLREQVLAMFDIDISGGDENAAKRRKDTVLLCRGFLVQEKAGYYAEQQEGMYTFLRGASAALAIACAFYFGWYLALTVGGHSMSLISFGLFAAIALGCILSRIASEKVTVIKWLSIVTLLIAGIGGILVNEVMTPVKLDQKTLEKAVEIGHTKIYDTDRFKKEINADPNLIRVYEIAERQGVYSRLGLYQNRGGFLMAMTLLALFLALECHRAFRVFARGWAATIYRDFYQVMQKQMKKLPQEPESSAAD